MSFPWQQFFTQSDLPAVGGVEIPRQNGGQKRGDWIQLRVEELSAAMSWGRYDLENTKIRW